MYIVIYNSNMEYVATIRDVEYDITRRVYDLDTSSFAGICEDKISDAFFFHAKSEEFNYSGWIKNFKQDGNLITFQGIDLKSLLDTEIELDFNETQHDYFKLDGIIDFVYDKISEKIPFSSTTMLSDADPYDIVYIANYSFQVIRVNAIQFLKPYLVLFNLYLYITWDEKTKGLKIEIKENSNELKIEDEDFIFDENRTSTKTNHTVASLIQIQEETTTNAVDFIPTSKEYYNSVAVGRRKDINGRFLMIPLDDEIKFQSIPLYEYDVSIYDDRIVIIPDDYFNRFLYKDEYFGGKFWLYIPYSKYYSLKGNGNKRDDIGPYYELAEEGPFGIHLVEYLAFKDGITYPYTDTIKMEKHNYTEFGEGWFLIDVSKSFVTPDEYPYDYLPIILPLNEAIPLNEHDEIKKMLASSVVWANSNNTKKLGIHKFNTEQYSSKYAQPIIEKFNNTSDMIKNVYRVKIDAFSQELKYNGTNTIVVSNTKDIFNITGDELNIPLDRITIYAGQTEQSSRAIFKDGKFQEMGGLGLTLYDYSFAEGNDLIYLDFGGFGYIRWTLSDNTLKASGQGGWYYKIEVEPLERYWQVGQVPKREKRLLQKHYYLGKDNQVYEETIPSNQKIYPEKVKYFQEEFLNNAQNKAITELVNSRYDMSLMVVDNDKVNPYELSKLGLLAQVEVVGKNDSVILPISEIRYNSKADNQVKLGFKKTLFTEVIKG